MKKLLCFFILIILLFGIYLMVIFKERDYQLNYEIENNKQTFIIKESYSKKNHAYSFKIKYKKRIYEYLNEEPYSINRELIKDVKSIKGKDFDCVYPIIKKVKTYPLCYLNNQSIDYYLINDKKLNKYKNNRAINKTTYNKITIYNNNYIYALWNYKGYYYINKDIKKNIKLFNNDTYENRLSVLVDNYLVVPDYDKKYEFNKFYLINLKNGKLKEWELEESLNFNGYILGVYNKKIYYVDKKDSKEYEIDPFRKKIIIIGDETKKGKIFLKNWKEISLIKLISKNYSFVYNNNYNYNILDNTLFLKNHNINTIKKISNLFSPKIIQQNHEYSYYLKDEILYEYNPYDGESKILSNYEWNFNNNNMIFIYNN